MTAIIYTESRFFLCARVRVTHVMDARARARVVEKAHARMKRIHIIYGKYTEN